MGSLCEVVEGKLIHYPTTQTEQEQELVMLEQKIIQLIQYYVSPSKIFYT